MRFVVVKRKRLIAVVLTAVLLVISTVALSLTGAYTVVAGRVNKRLPIYSVKTEEKKVAISFDASWGAEKTLSILQTLEDYDVVANFFAVGFWAEKYSETLKKLADSGRIEIGTHSNTHPHMGRLSREQIATELDTSTRIIQEITGKEITLFRAPYGEYSDALIEEAENRGLYTIQWDVDSLDWKGLSANEMSARVLNRVSEGSIVLMHNDGENTLKALPLIIEGLKNKGYTLVTISDLIYKDNYEIDHTGKQILKG